MKKTIKFNILTLFPEIFKVLENYSVIGRALQKGVIKLQIYPLREFGLGKYRQVDDKPYGGGPGMILRVDVIDRALQKIKAENPETYIILLDARGKQLDQKKIKELARKGNLTLICGHYEGVDERARDLVDETISVGPYVLSGGELPALTIVDAVSRLVPGVLGNLSSLKEESYTDSALEYPQYTRPEEYQGKKVPQVLLSGNHQEIERWRKKHRQPLS